MWLSVGLKIIPYFISSLQSFTFLSHKVINDMSRKLFSLIKCFSLAFSCLRMQRIYIYIINIRTQLPRCILIATWIQGANRSKKNLSETLLPPFPTVASTPSFPFYTVIEASGSISGKI